MNPISQVFSEDFSNYWRNNKHKNFQWTSASFLTWSKVASFFVSWVWTTVQRSSEEKSFISMFSLMASSTSFFSLFILTMFTSASFLNKKLLLCYFSLASLEFYFLRIKSVSPASRCPSGDCSLPNIHQLRSYCHKLRAIRVQGCDWSKFADPVIGSVLGLWLVAVTLDFWLWFFSPIVFKIREKVVEYLDIKCFCSLEFNSLKCQLFIFVNKIVLLHGHFSVQTSLLILGGNDFSISSAADGWLSWTNMANSYNMKACCPLRLSSSTTDLFPLCLLFIEVGLSEYLVSLWQNRAAQITTSECWLQAL